MTEGRSTDLARLVDLVELFGQQTILLLGDFVADEFVSGEISRVSREAPVLILRHRETFTVPGGGANAANNLIDLGARVRMVSALGTDAAGDQLVEYFRAKRVDTSGLVRVPNWTTPAKTRFLAGWPHTTFQQVLRMDREPRQAVPARDVDLLVRKARKWLSGATAMLVSDYGYGTATPDRLRAIRGRKPWPAPVALDSRYRLQDYAGLGLTAATPNEAELEAMHNTRFAPGTVQMEQHARQTLTRMGIHALVVTRGRDGMTVFERRRSPQSLPIFGSDQAVDVTGAGDTVIAAFCLAMAAGATTVEAAQLANYAGGIVVMKRGTATVTCEELLAAIHSDATGALPVKK